MVQQFSSEYLFEEHRNTHLKNACTTMFITALFTISQDEKKKPTIQQSTDECLKKMWYI